MSLPIFFSLILMKDKLYFMFSWRDPMWNEFHFSLPYPWLASLAGMCLLVALSLALFHVRDVDRGYSKD